MSLASPESIAVSCTPCVLVVGAPLVGKSLLCQGITNSEELPNGMCTPWTIQTKYYKARVDVHEASSSNIDNLSRPEALLLIFNLATPSTFEVVRLISGRFLLETVGIKLLCGTHADSLVTPGSSPEKLETISQPTWFQNVADWCILNGFEFVICCPLVPALDALLAVDGHRQGIARVVEALHAHAWPNLDMLPPSKGTTHGAQGTDSRPGYSVHTYGLGCVENSRLEEASEPQVPKQRDLLHGEQQLADKEHGEGRLRFGISPEDAEAAHAEGMLDGLERLMEEMKGHKARLANLPDDERRDQAAAIALRMLEMLGIDEEPSSGEA